VAPLSVSTDPLDRLAAARDLWPSGTLALWLGEPYAVPDEVCWPTSDEEVAASLTGERRWVVQGAGSGVCGGASGEPGDRVIDTKRLHRIGDVDPVTWTVEVDAGVNGQVLEDHLVARGWTLGHSPSSIGCSTVGGWVAARSAGQFSSRYGVIEDMVVGLDAVSPKVGAFVLGVAGPRSPSQRLPASWLPMWVGSEGTLGVIVRLRLRVRPTPETRWLRGYRFPDVPTALTAMRGLMQAELWPSVVRLYDPVDTRIGGKTKPKGHDGPAWWKRWLAAVDALPAVHRRTVALPLSLPGFVQSLLESVSSGCLLIVGFEGDRAVVDPASSAGHALVQAAGGVDLGEEPGWRWFHSRHAVSYKLMPVFERGGFADTMEVAAPWSRLTAVYEGVRAAVRGKALVMAHLSHVYPEGGCIYFSFAGRGDRTAYQATWSAALEAVVASGATVTHHHGVGALKAAAVSAEIGPSVRGWQAAKAMFDPEGGMNTGRLFVPTTKRSPLPRVDPAVDGLGEGEPLWGFAATEGEVLPWAREAWMAPWATVVGSVAGETVALGRAPRSASGPDLRGWLAKEGRDVAVSVPTTTQPPGLSACFDVAEPWRTAQDLLRADLRPAVLEVEGGALVVGFRGPAAAAFLARAGEVAGVAPRPTPWRAPRRRGAGLVPVPTPDPTCVGVTTHHFLRPPDATEAAWRT
jgi:alkyldihydroxyacetonephosphate synthase